MVQTKYVPDPQSDPRALTAGEGIVLRYLAKRANLVRFFAARAATPAAAEDLTQELYLKLAGRPRGEEPENPEALLYRIALNLMLDRARGETRSAARDTEWRATHRTVLAGQELADEAPADEAAASRERLRRLVEALAELPPQMRRAFTLHKLEGCSHAETAQAMGLSVKSVEKHISAALKLLTERLSP